MQQPPNTGWAVGPGGYPASAAPPGGYPPSAAPPGGYPPSVAPPGGYPPSVAPPGGYPATAASAPPLNQAPPGGDVRGPDLAEGHIKEDVNWDMEPTAPPMEKMDTIPGYDKNMLGGGDVPPPSYGEVIHGTSPPDRSASTDMPMLNEERAREALLEFVSQNCCYGKSAAQDLNIRDMEQTMAFHYTLETVTESRTTAWTVEPYTAGQPVDGPQNGPAPGPWDIAVYPKQKFQDDKAPPIEVPHTASVKLCHTCNGHCQLECRQCYGMGRTTCNTCHGRGYRMVYRQQHQERHSCTWCHGTGRRRCSCCHGSGQVTCRTCLGRGQIKCYIRLTVVWKKRYGEHILERTALPDKLIKKATGHLAFQEEHPMVWPVSHFPEQTINDASHQLVEKHRTSWPLERIVLQRHRVRVVPVNQINYIWKNKEGVYFVYGTENKVYAANYPQKWCCGCVVL